MTTLHWVTCRQNLPEGKEDLEYFAQVSIGWSPEKEVHKAAEDVQRCLFYAETVNNTIVDMLNFADEEPPEILYMGKADYLERARDLCSILTDLMDEAGRRVKMLSGFIDGQTIKKQAGKEF